MKDKNDQIKLFKFYNIVVYELFMKYPLIMYAVHNIYKTFA